jgi:hypothetical protein
MAAKVLLFPDSHPCFYFAPFGLLHFLPRVPAIATLLLFNYFYGVETNQQSKTTRWKAWLKKLGFIGFLFFLLKGLVWLAIGYFIIR